ncbi:MAG: glutathione S-transferase [Sphingomonadales bacterium]|nr:glutathione S-transferase [Sphingomonadales bacterium]
MVIVYGTSPSRAVRVLWMLEEMGLAYEVRGVDFANRFDDVGFIEASPTGAMPGIVDGDVRMMESVAILEYLGARYGPTPLVPEQDDPGWPTYLSFLHFGEASLAAPLNVTIASRFSAREDQKQNWGAQFAIDLFVRKSAALIHPLRHHPYVAGDIFTAADISCAYPLGLAFMLGVEDQLDPVLLNYLARIRERPAFQVASARRPA